MSIFRQNSMWKRIAKKRPKKSCLGASGTPFGRGLGAFGRLWGVLGRLLGVFWTPLGRSWASFGHLLGLLGASWALRVRFGVRFQPSRLELGSILEGSGEDLGRIWEVLGGFRPKFGWILDRYGKRDE